MTRTKILVSSLLIACWPIAAACGSAQRPPCEGAACSSLCPAGSMVDWSSDLARTCTVGANVEIAVPTETGKGKLDTRCETADGVQFICRPIVGSEICGPRGIESISRDHVQCGHADACQEGRRMCTSDTAYIACSAGQWSPTAACPSDSRCFDGECLPQLRANCDELPPFKGCGGDLTGKWTPALSCMSANRDGCPSVTTEASGSISFDGERHTEQPGIEFSRRLTFRDECPDFEHACRDWSAVFWHCRLGKGECVCTGPPMLKSMPLDRPSPESYCRRGNVLDMSFGVERIRFVLTP